MTDKQKERLKKKLLNQREEHLRDFARTKSKVNHKDKGSNGELTKYPLHPADLGTDTAIREENDIIGNIQSNILDMIDNSLEKIKNKEYGKCELCKKKISYSRLNAIPWATLCLKCKKELEKRRVY